MEGVGLTNPIRVIPPRLVGGKLRGFKGTARRHVKKYKRRVMKRNRGEVSRTAAHQHRSLGYCIDDETKKGTECFYAFLSLWESA